MNINKYIEQAYAFFTALAKELVKELRTDNKDVTTGLVEAKNAIVEATNDGSVKVSDGLANVVEAINNKPVVESVEISNLDELIDGVNGVIDTLKTELSKIDKEIVVKNDLSQLTALFKSGEDKKDLVKALNKIEKSVKDAEAPDYSAILEELVGLTEEINKKEAKEVDLKGVEALLSQMAVYLSEPLLPKEVLTYDNRLRVELSEKQLQKMGGGSVSVAGGGLNDVDRATLNTLSKETKQDTQIGLETVIVSLAETIQELNQRLAFFGSIKQHQTESLRVTALTGSTTAVTGSLTSAGTVTTVGAITNFGTGYPALEVSHDINNSTAILANIQNVVVT